MPEIIEKTPRLSRRQSQVLGFIRSHVSRYGYSPTIREIGANVGLSSTSTVFEHLRSLVKKGFLARKPGTCRALTLVEPEPSTADNILKQWLDVCEEPTEEGLRKAVEATCMRAGRPVPPLYQLSRVLVAR